MAVDGHDDAAPLVHGSQVGLLLLIYNGEASGFPNRGSDWGRSA